MSENEKCPKCGWKLKGVVHLAVCGEEKKVITGYDIETFNEKFLKDAWTFVQKDAGYKNATKDWSNDFLRGFLDDIFEQTFPNLLQIIEKKYRELK